MAGFCGNCGRPLVDGQPCSCMTAKRDENRTVHAGTGYNPAVGAPTGGYNPATGAPAGGYNPATGAPAGGYNPATGAPAGGYNPATGAPVGGYNPATGAPAGGYNPATGAPVGGRNPGAGQPDYVANFTKEAKGALRELLPLLKQPLTRTVALAGSGNRSVGITGILAEMLSCVILVAVVWKSLVNYIIQDLGFDYAEEIDEVYATLDRAGFSGPKLIMITVVCVVGFALLRALFLKLFTKDVFKGDTNYSAMLTVVGTRSLFMAILLLAALLVGFLSPLWGIGLFALAVGAVNAIEPVCYMSVARLDGNKKLFVYMIAMVVMMIVTLIVVKAGGSAFFGNVKYVIGEYFW